MEFNEIWTKEKNDLLRKMKKTGKTKDEIIEYFGNDLNYEPKHRYTGNGKYILSFEYYTKMNEIKIAPKEIEYKSEMIRNTFFKNRYDYLINFTLNNHNYVIRFFYYVSENKNSYQLLFTTLEQYNKFIDEMNKIIVYTEVEHEKLKSIVEKETKYNELIPAMKAISYIIFDFYPNINNIPLTLGDTDDKVKINLYRNIIKDSFPNVSESIGKDGDGNPLYYYKIN
jgi:hypothetical protein